MLKHDEIQDRQDVAPVSRPPDPTARSHDLERQAPVSLVNLTVIIGCVVLFIGLLWWVHHRAAVAAQVAASAHAAVPEVPVIEGRVQQKNVPIYLDGLGTVIAYNTVTVHVRVDGELKKVAFTEGQDVHAGDLLAQIDPDPFRTALEQAVAKKGEDEAALANAQLDLQRDADLYQQKIATQQTYDTQKALVDQLAATVKADQAAIDSARVQLNYTTVVSPLDGRIGIRLVDQGNIVHATDTNGLVVITQLKPISLIFTLPEQTLSQIRKVGGSDGITVLAVDRDNSTILGQGTLAVIDNQIDVSTGQIRLKANFPNENLRLWPGQFVNARLLLTTRENGLVVPASVVQRGPDGPYAFVIKDDNTVEVRPVKVAQIEKDEALIDDGLKANERVVVDGQYKLQVGSHVKPAASTKSANARS
ncbi:MAG TPA: efflux RND transporter periplasmic adaptor subunit [Verrucomicrobiae bacterium]|nr:efflux RND transporter periplasmic adaptor subunit [Verrucomicrobiae bacterium]